jgi:hypothetical protein
LSPKKQSASVKLGQNESVDRKIARKASSKCCIPQKNIEKSTEIPGLVIFNPSDFEYASLIGEGAYGRVRKSYKNEVVENVSSFSSCNTAASSTTNSASKSLERHMHISSKLAVRKPKSVATSKQTYAVKIQSKYQLIVGKQEEHLFNEISLMS